ncbi:hypothetical protein KFE25_013148 [Diacronema lutheri]|uniref:Uncharacterized protein n=2 Tax=Diacronema lutheri TaxID=2081491 RepID=A0A8J5XBH0_DIALT|nr:hypothetical protein KFE25_013148 [Diacronema lutheri]
MREGADRAVSGRPERSARGRALLPLFALAARPAGTRANGEHAVFSMACTYKRADVEVFVGSLRATGFDGHVQFGVDAALDNVTASYYASERVTTDSIPCETIPLLTDALRASHGLWLGGLNQVRYSHYVRWLDERPSLVWVWLLDARDVVFVRHPFERSPPAIALFAEMPASSVWVNQRVSTCFGERAAREMMATLRYNLCGGTVYGTAASLRRFSDAMLGVAKRMSVDGAKRRVCHVNDQPLINYLAWQQGMRAPGAHETTELGAVQLHGLFQGPALTIKTPRVCEVFTLLLQKRQNGTGQIAIVHKWNKCPAARAFAAARYPHLPVARARSWRRR